MAVLRRSHISLLITLDKADPHSFGNKGNPVKSAGVARSGPHSTGTSTSSENSSFS